MLKTEYKTEVIVTRIEPSLKRAAMARAHGLGITRNEYLRRLILVDLRKYSNMNLKESEGKEK